jgi:hypothetical protein
MSLNSNRGPQSSHEYNDSLDFEEPSDHARPPLSATGATLLDILGVVGRNDILAGFGMVHHGLVMREEAIEDPIEYAGSDERIYIANGEPAGVELSA